MVAKKEVELERERKLLEKSFRQELAKEFR